MKLEDQVVSLELAKKLKELGVKQESLFWWNEINELVIDPKHPASWYDGQNVNPTIYSAFTVAELGEMLPERFNLPHKAAVCRPLEWGVHVYEKRIVRIEAATEADARAKMLIYVIENKLITNP